MSNNKKKAWADSGLKDWGAYMAAKKEKLEDQFQEAAQAEFEDTTTLFSGIAIFVNGYTRPCADELRRLMMAHGGIYHHYMRPGTTSHIIASNLPYSKIVMYRKSQNPLPICKPEWITDSIKAGKLLDWRPFLLYSNYTKTQPQLAFPGRQENSVVAEEADAEKQFKRPVEKERTAFEAELSYPGPSNVHTFVNNDVEKVSSKVELSRPGPSNAHTFAKNDTEEKGNIVAEGEKASSKVVSNHRRSGNAPMSTKNSEFLTEFYNNSRLHHISTMGATFKDYVNELRAKSDGTFPGLERLKTLKTSKTLRFEMENDIDSDEDLFACPTESIKKTSNDPVIMHIDMDCFFVSVGLRNRPELRGFPVAVTHAKGNKVGSRGTSENSESNEELGSMSEVASCSYEAREAGVKNGMFLGQALKLCPSLKTIQYDFEGYKEVSFALYDSVASYTLSIEAVSCDEMYADVSKILSQTGLTPLEFATIIRNEIKEKTRCPVSTGFGYNKLQARLATRKAKPDGQFYLENSQFREYIADTVVRDLPGVGYSTMQLLKKMNVRTCSELHEISLIVLQKEFGKKTGEMLYNMCRGIDNSKLTVEHVRKSVSAEVNYGIRFESSGEAEQFLEKLSQEVCSRLQKANSKGRSITLKLMVRAKDAPKETLKFMGHGVCDNFTKSKNLIAPIDDPIIITREVISLWNQMQQPYEDIRGIGIQINRLESTTNRVGSMINFLSKPKEGNVRNNIVNEKKTISEKAKNDEKLSKNRETKVGGLKTYFASKELQKPKKSIEEDNIDQDVLAELPEDIRKEILESRGLKTDKKNAKSSNDYAISKNNVAIKSNHKDDSPPSTSTSDQKSHEYDESVLKELPEDIRNEIIGSKQIVSEPKEKKTSSSRQTHQENYFQQRKPSYGKSEKVALPSLREIDMSVLIELPEDIRNEIINEYKANKEEQKEKKDETKVVETEKIAKKEENHQVEKRSEFYEDPNLSFSQIDPAFLAALSEDVKTDVELYCMVKKKEKLAKMKKTTESNLGMKNVLGKNRNVLKPKNPRLQKSKNTESKSSTVSKSSRQNVQQSTERKQKKEKSEDQEKRENKRFLNNDLDTNVPGTPEQREDIISHHTSFTGKKAKTEEQEMVTNLVNYLFTVPRQQIKMQIQTWISKSNEVNEIDLLSLATFLSMLPKKKQLEDLHVLLKTMHRCITKTGNCVWHETYRRTVRHVQRYMQIEYNSNLMLPSMKCDRCDCEEDQYV